MGEDFYRIRYAVRTDTPFIVDSWLKSDQHTRQARDVGRGIYFANHSKVVKAILARGDTRTLVAHVPDNEDAILGWAAMGLNTAYYVYVRSDARRMGIARALLAPLLGRKGVDYTHAPAVWVPLTPEERIDTPHRKDKPLPAPPGWSYNPYRNYLHETSQRPSEGVVP